MPKRSRRRVESAPPRVWDDRHNVVESQGNVELLARQRHYFELPVPSFMRSEQSVKKRSRSVRRLVGERGDQRLTSFTVLEAIREKSRDIPLRDLDQPGRAVGKSLCDGNAYNHS